MKEVNKEAVRILINANKEQIGMVELVSAIILPLYNSLIEVYRKEQDIDTMNDYKEEKEILEIRLTDFKQAFTMNYRALGLLLKKEEE